MRRGVIAIIVIAVLAALSWVGYARFATSSQEESAVQSEEKIVVQRGRLVASINASGTVMPNEQVSLVFDTPGRVAEVLVEEGQTVRKGDVLARLDTTDLELAVRQAEINLEIAQAQLERLRNPASSEAERRAAEAQVQSAEANLAKLKEGPSAAEIAAARASLEAAQAALDRLLAGPDPVQLASAQQRLKNAEAALRQAQAAYDQVKWRPDVAMLPQSLQLEQATIEYEAARIAYEEVANSPTPEQIAQARAQVESARANLQRLLETPSEADILAAEAQVEQARANLQRLRGEVNPTDLRIQEAQVEQAELALEQARHNLDGATIVAPFDGTIANVNIKPYELVSSATPAIVLADMSRFELEVGVDELDVGQVKVGNAVTVTLDAYRNGVMRGRVTHVAPVARVDAQGVATYPVRVDLDLATAPGPLRPGMTGNAQIVTQVLEDVLIIPNRAISIDRTTGKLSVWKIENGTPVSVEIAIGLRGDTHSEVIAGLEEGDIVIIPSIDRREQLRRQLEGN
nr:efflux RND transporter periplasmic adaptor subunit [Ardenticatena sp.]